jgi:hypothetical protein
MRVIHILQSELERYTSGIFAALGLFKSVLNLPYQVYVIRHDNKGICYYTAFIFQKAQAFDNNILEGIII